MKYRNIKLATKVNAIFLLLLSLGFVFIVSQLADYIGLLTDVASRTQITTAYLFSPVLFLIALYIMRDLNSHRKLLKWMMGVLSVISIALLIYVFLLSRLLFLYGGAEVNVDIAVCLIVPVICIVLFIWLMVDRPKKV